MISKKKFIYRKYQIVFLFKNKLFYHVKKFYNSYYKFANNVINALIIINQLTKKFIIDDFEIIKFNVKTIINIELIFRFYYYVTMFIKFK